MITEFKRKDVISGKVKDSEMFVNIKTLIADRLRALYSASGWNHMLLEPAQCDNLVDEVTDFCLNYCLRDIESNASSAGLALSAYFDEDGYLNLDYSFTII